MALRPGAKKVIIIFLIAAAFFEVWKFLSINPDIVTAIIEKKNEEPEIPNPSVIIDAPIIATIPTIPVIPTIKKINMNNPARVLAISKSANLGLYFANGDVITTPDSILGSRGIKLDIQDRDYNYTSIVSELLLFAKNIEKGEDTPNVGAAFVIIAGDMCPEFITKIDHHLKKIGHSLQIIGALGYSRGENKLMLPPIVVENPQAARGMTIAGIPRSSDLHVAFKWASDNKIPINVDSKTWDSNSLNIIESKNINDTSEKYITEYKEARDIIKNGINTKEKKIIKIDGVAIQTPGDIKTIQKKGGLAVIASTKQYIWQTPSVIIGNTKWMSKHPDIVKNIIAGAMEGGNQVRSSEFNLVKAGNIAAKIHKVEDADWWVKHHNGIIEKDSTGIQVQLGGAITISLEDNIRLFGLNGNDCLFEKVYNVFGNIDQQYYSKEISSFINYNEIINTSYLKSLMNEK